MGVSCAIRVCVCAAIGLLIGCQSTSLRRASANTVPRLNAAQATMVGLSSEEAQAAAKLCTTKCMRCHQFYHPADYGETEWRSWMTKMNRKARLTPDQAALLTRYFAGLLTR
ncbi:MAG: hypothetical protein KGS61_21415 [Verrucomicrobia bacterium]|nr:hypothetical protein [Verrucomicrobiota bacterium]